MPLTRSMPLTKRAALLLTALLASGCTAVTVAGVVMDALTDVAFTFEGDEQTASSLREQLLDEFGVETAISAVETGVYVIELVGAYAAVIEALAWMTAQGIELLANDAVSEAVLTVAISLLK